MFLRGVILLVLIAIFGGHTSELFDRWDHTLRTGKDADYAVVIVAACIGVVFVEIRKLVAFLKRVLSAEQLRNFLQVLPAVQRGAAHAAATGPSPPLLIPIRI